MYKVMNLTVKSTSTFFKVQLSFPLLEIINMQQTLSLIYKPIFVEVKKYNEQIAHILMLLLKYKFKTPPQHKFPFFALSCL